eukprot:383392_1
MADTYEMRQLLLVAGYVRNIELTHNLSNIPREINNIIYIYQRLCDIWSEEYSSSWVEIDSTKSKIKFETSSDATAFGKTVVTEGIFVWRVQIISIKFGVWQAPPYVGIVEATEQNLYSFQNSSSFEDAGYQLCGGSNTLCGMNENPLNKFRTDITVDYSCYWNKPNDILEIVLNLNERTLGFIVNGIDYGVAFRNIKQTNYCLALSYAGCAGSEFLFL